MELEEQLYTKLTIESSEIQVLLCDSSDNWRDAKNENDSDLHIVPKCSFSATMAYCVQALKTIPKQVSSMFSSILCVIEWISIFRRILCVLKWMHGELHPRVDSHVCNAESFFQLQI